MAIYSHSRISTFEQCKLKYKFRYIEKIIPEVEITIEVHLGKCVHDILEWLYKQVKDGKIPTIDETIVYYMQVWKKNYNDGIVINRKKLDAKYYFNQGIKFILDYYLEHQPFDDNTLEVEKMIVVNLDEKGNYKVQGFIDRLAYNLQTGEYEIHDYKTGNALPDSEKINNDKQLALYALAIKNLYGKDSDVCLIWHYLNFNKKICIKKNNEQLEELRNEVIRLIKEIESETNFPSRKSGLCDWCEYQNMCPEFNPNFEKQKVKEEL